MHEPGGGGLPHPLPHVPLPHQLLHHRLVARAHTHPRKTHSHVHTHAPLSLREGVHSDACARTHARTHAMRDHESAHAYATPARSLASEVTRKRAPRSSLPSDAAQRCSDAASLGFLDRAGNAPHSQRTPARTQARTRTRINARGVRYLPWPREALLDVASRFLGGLQARPPPSPAALSPQHAPSPPSAPAQARPAQARTAKARTAPPRTLSGPFAF